MDERDVGTVEITEVALTKAPVVQHGDDRIATEGQLDGLEGSVQVSGEHCVDRGASATVSEIGRGLASLG